MLSQSVNSQTCQWLSEAVVQRLFSRAAKEFTEQTYDINKIAREMIFSLEDGDSQEKKYNTSRQQISNQVLSFCSLLGSTPKYFIQLLNEEVITSHSHIITLNSKNELVARRFFKDFSSLCAQADSFPDYFRNDKLTRQMYAFINAVARKTCKVYEQCSKLFKMHIDTLTAKIKQSRIINNYLLYKLFRDISVSTKILVEEKCQETVFRNCTFDVIEIFFNYIINKFEVIKLFANQEIESSMFEPSPIVFFGRLEKNPSIELVSKEAVNEEGKFAIFVKTYSEDAEIQNSLEDYLIILDDHENLRVINCKTLRKRWYIINDIQTYVKMTQIANDYILNGQGFIDSLMKDKSEPIERLMECEPLESYTNFNGIIGRSLYLMKKYAGVSEFFKDLSKRAILTRSMQQIMHQIPIVGYMIFAGTFSANFYKIFSNKFSTDKKKFKEFGGFMLNTTTTVGTSILGAITGQMLIPIPIVGALIGSIIGGYIGDKGGKQLNSWIEKQKFNETIKFLLKTQVDQQYWLCTPEFFKTLEIRKSEFVKYVPTFMQDVVFATMIGFVLACFYESKRLNEYNLQKSKKLKSVEGGYRGRQKQFEQEIHRMNLEEDFQTEFNIMRMVDYLEQHHAFLYDHYETLEKSILTNLSKIIN